MTTEPAQFTIIFQDENLEDVLSSARDVGAVDVRQENRRGFTGVELAVIGAVAIPLLANLIIKFAERWSCGIRVDARTGQFVTERDCDLPRGSVLVVTADGSQLHRPGEMGAAKLSDLLGSLLR